MQSLETQIAMVKWTNAGGQTKGANEQSFVYRPPVWRRSRNVKTIYRIMPELRGLLINNDRARSARSLFLRRPMGESIIRFNGPFHCFRTSRSLLWPLKWSSRLLFVIWPPVPRQWPALPFIENSNLFKTLERCIKVGTVTPFLRRNLINLWGNTLTPMTSEHFVSISWTKCVGISLSIRWTSL